VEWEEFRKPTTNRTLTSLVTPFCVTFSIHRFTIKFATNISTTSSKTKKRKETELNREANDDNVTSTSPPCACPTPPTAGPIYEAPVLSVADLRPINDDIRGYLDRSDTVDECLASYGNALDKTAEWREATGAAARLLKSNAGLENSFDFAAELGVIKQDESDVESLFYRYAYAQVLQTANFWPTILTVALLLHGSVYLLSLVCHVCIVAKRYVLPVNCDSLITIVLLLVRANHRVLVQSQTLFVLMCCAFVVKRDANCSVADRRFAASWTICCTISTQLIKGKCSSRVMLMIVSADR